MSFDTGFSLVPTDGELTVDERLDAALAGLMPDTAPDVQRPLGRGWAFDFETGEFVAHGSSPAIVLGVEQLVVWIEKTLRTARFAHAIYDDEYGTEYPFDAVGQQFTPALAGNLRRSIEESLRVHDRIEDITEFTFTGEGHTLYVNFRVVTDQEEIEITQIPLGGNV